MDYLLGVFALMVILCVIIGIVAAIVSLGNYLAGNSSSYGSVWFKWLLYPFLVLAFGLANWTLPSLSNSHLVALLISALIAALCIYTGHLLRNHSKTGSGLLQIQGLMTIVLSIVDFVTYYWHR